MSIEFKRTIISFGVVQYCHEKGEGLFSLSFHSFFSWLKTQSDLKIKQFFVWNRLIEGIEEHLP